MRGCTQCGECLNVCPVFRQFRREEFSPKSKRLLMEPVLETGDDGSPFTWEEIFSLARLCAGCGRCKQACARRLSTADLLAEVRASHPHWTHRLWELWIKHLGPLWPTVGFLASLAPRGLAPAMVESSLAAAAALVAKKNTAPWVRVSGCAGPDGGPVALFSGCTARNVRPKWTKTAETLLRSCGYTLPDASPFTCCGGTMRHAGQFAVMETMRRANVEAWKTMGKPRIAVFCASCHHSLLEYAEAFLEGGEAVEWKQCILPLSVLLDKAEGDVLPGMPVRYGYHQPCHWEKDADMPFLSRLMPGLEKGTGICCGMGGILQMTDPDVSAAMAKTCLEGIPGDISSVLTGCSGCAMHLAAFARPGLTVLHWLDVVFE